MKSRDLIDPELIAAAEAFPELDLSPSGLAESRAKMDFLRRSLPSGAIPDGVVVEEHEASVASASAVRALVYRPGWEAKRPAILALHGGGFVMGEPEMDDGENRRLARALDCVIVSPDYRLAPEAPFPAALNDCYATLLWMKMSANRLGIDADRIAILGKSAGAGLAAGVALMARDRGEVALVHQHLIYPMLDDREPRGTGHVGQFVFRREDHRNCWAAYLGHTPGRVGVSPYAAPARASSLEKLPPTFISVGSLDLFLKEDVDYARRLETAGVEVELHVYPGAYHGFDMVPGAGVSVSHDSARMAALSRVLYGTEIEPGTCLPSFPAGI